jgi:hypothetical protein
MPKRNKKSRAAEDRRYSQEVGRVLADRINERRARRGLPADPRLDVALDKTWAEMTSEERSGQVALREETTRALEESIAYHQARIAAGYD